MANNDFFSQFGMNPNSDSDGPKKVSILEFLKQNRQKKDRKKIPKSIKIPIFILLILVVLFFALSNFITDILWFEQIGYLSVLLVKYKAFILLFLISFIFSFFLLFLSIKIAYNSRNSYIKNSDDSFVSKTLGKHKSLFDKFRKIIMLGIPAVISAFIAFSFATNWQLVLQFLNSTPFGKKDPQFNLDASFYVFKLPMLKQMLSFLLLIFIACSIVNFVTNLIYSNIKVKKVRQNINIPVFSKSSGIQTSVLLGIVFIIISVTIFISRYSLVLNQNASFVSDGATYKNINADLPANTILTILFLLVALLIFFMPIYKKVTVPIIGICSSIVLGILLGGIYPILVQALIVNPNAQVKENTYIQRNIDSTLDSYNIKSVETQNYSAKTDAKAGALRKDTDSTTQIRLLDPTVVSPTFRQLQQNKQYYDFPETLAVDRYNVDGNKKDTVLGVRNLKVSAIGDSNSWVNQHTVYTHGYGVVAAYGNTTDKDGRPAFFEDNIPSSGKMGEYEPRVYFGTGEPNYSIVGAPEGTTPWELDYPDDSKVSGQENTTYKGDGGPKISSLWSRVMFAVKFHSLDILFTNRINSESQVLFNRDPQDRVQKVAPYLTLDERTYPAVVDKKLVWVVDGYTTSNNYPYAQHTNLADVTEDALTDDASETGLKSLNSQEINYIRNSVKAVVDAYTGKITLYAWDTNDPILKTYAKIYKNTLHPMSEISSSLMSHLRYPESIFKVQRDMLTKYHVKDASAFYSGQGFWKIPADPTNTESNANVNQPPYYLTMKMPGQDEASFSLSSTYIPIGSGKDSRNILTGFLAVNSETGSEKGKVSSDYGQLRLLQLPQSSTVSGPGQVQNLFNSDATVQSVLRLLRDGGSQVINGNLLTLPVGGGLLYVEPVYVQSSSGTQFPSLQKVLVSFGDKVGFSDNLSSALNQIFGGDSGAATGDQKVKSSVSNSSKSLSKAQIIKNALSDAEKAIEDSKEALKNNDWAAYGKAQARLSKAIDEAMAAQNGK